MKKIIIILLIIILSLILLIRPKNEDENTIVFWTLQLGTFDKYINNIIKEYENENPEIHIKWIDVPYSEGEKRSLASVLTDNPPDLVNLTPDFSLVLAQKGALYTIDEDKLKDYPQSILDMLKFDNKYFGIPFYATSAVTLYNKSFNIEKLPETYTELFNLKLKDNKNSYLTMISLCENDTLLKLLNKYNINSPETINNTTSTEIYKKIKYLYDNNLIPKESVTQSHRDALEKYMSGQIAFIVTGANFINMIKENAPAVYKDTVILPQLTGETALYDFSLMNFVIPKRAKHKEQAVDFALYLTNKQNQLEFAKLTTILPVNSKALKDDYFTVQDNSDLQTQARIISANQLNKLQPPLKNIKNKKELNTMSANYVQQILINNTDIKTTLDEFALNWQKL